MFVSKNEPENFGWHDAEIIKICCENEDMIWKVDALNVLSSNSQNADGFDRSTSTADVVFKKYKINSIKKYGFKAYQYGNLIEEQSDRMLSCEEISRLLDEISVSTDETYARYIYKVKSYIDGKQLHIDFDIDLMSEGGDVCVEIICDELIIKWEKFRGELWNIGVL